jgi:hypothetical protein
MESKTGIRLQNEENPRAGKNYVHQQEFAKIGIKCGFALLAMTSFSSRQSSDQKSSSADAGDSSQQAHDINSVLPKAD